MIKLWENNTPFFNPDFKQEEPCLEEFPVEGSKTAVIVIPGGAYWFRAEGNEGTDIIKVLNSFGYTCFMLKYRITPYHHPVELLDAQRAVRVVRSLADKYGYSPDRIAVIGFSAGGHLAFSLCSHFDGGRTDGDEIDRFSCRPDVGGLGYPVTTLVGDLQHAGSTVNLLGKDYDPELAKSLSYPDAIPEDNPPMFIWHTREDLVVNVRGSLQCAEAYVLKGIPVELHVYPFENHGLGPAVGHHAETWLPLFSKFIDMIFRKRDGK